MAEGELHLPLQNEIVPEGETVEMLSNDVTVDAEHRIYFTDPRYLGSEPAEASTTPRV